MPGYVSKSGLIYSSEEVAKIVSNEDWARNDTRMNGRPFHQQIKEAEIPSIIEKYERDKAYGDTSGRN